MGEFELNKVYPFGKVNVVLSLLIEMIMGFEPLYWTDTRLKHAEVYLQAAFRISVSTEWSVDAFDALNKRLDEVREEMTRRGIEWNIT